VTAGDPLSFPAEDAASPTDSRGRVIYSTHKKAIFKRFMGAPQPRDIADRRGQAGKIFLPPATGDGIVAALPITRQGWMKKRTAS
jgi:hypothetical protein